MNIFSEEKDIFNRGFSLIGGIDEAGRGPLAGPVVAACVTIKSDQINDLEKFRQINDSKKLTAKKREYLFNFIKENFFEVGVGISDHNTVDKINIFQATFLAMKKAIGVLNKKPDFILVDGKFAIPNLSIPQKAVIGGDSLVILIAAASIIAKVTRDKIMQEFHLNYGHYGFDKHKGYGTKQHMENIKTFGPCPIHRVSFEPIKSLIGQKKK
jgi:ribonuclease HII